MSQIERFYETNQENKSALLKTVEQKNNLMPHVLEIISYLLNSVECSSNVVTARFEVGRSATEHACRQLCDRTFLKTSTT
jgi:Tfp pilus assembly protein PilE